MGWILSLFVSKYIFPNIKWCVGIFRWSSSILNMEPASDVILLEESLVLTIQINHLSKLPFWLNMCCLCIIQMRTTKPWLFITTRLLWIALSVTVSNTISSTEANRRKRESADHLAMKNLLNKFRTKCSSFINSGILIPSYLVIHISKNNNYMGGFHKPTYALYQAFKPQKGCIKPRRRA